MSKKLQGPCINLEPHDLLIVENSYQDVAATTWNPPTILTQVTQILVCRKCGGVINPWEEIDE